MDRTRPLVERDPARHAAPAPRRARASTASCSCATAPSDPRARVPRPRVHGLEERRRHQLRADRHRRRRARLPRLLEARRRAPRQGRAASRRTPQQCPTHRRARSSRSAPTSVACARSSSSPRTTTTALRQLPPRRQQPLQPRRPTAGSCAAWLELTDNPDSYMLLMEQRPDGLPDPATEVRVPLHRGARFVVDTQRLWHVVVPHRHRAALRAHRQLRERPRARRLDPLPTPVVDRDRAVAIAHTGIAIANPIPEATSIGSSASARSRRDDRLLDIGCGRGELLLRGVERAGCSAVGIDQSPRQIAIARGEAARRVPDADVVFYEAAAGAVPLEMHSFRCRCVRRLRLARVRRALSRARR